MEELEIDCGAFGKIKRTSPPAQGDWAIKDGRLTLLGCIVRGLVTLSREELLPFLDAMDAQDACIQTLAERIVELDLEAMEKCRQLDTLRARVEKLEEHVRKMQAVCAEAHRVYEEVRHNTKSVQEEQDVNKVMDVFYTLQLVTEAALAGREEV